MHAFLARHPWWIKVALALSVAGLVLGSAAFAINTAEALEQRTAATAAADLRLAVLTVVSVQSLEDAGPEERSRLNEAVLALQNPNSALLHQSPEIQEQVSVLLAELESHGQMILAGHSPGDHGLMEHEGLQMLVRDAAVDASDEADQALASARLGAIVALLAAVLGGSAWLMLRSLALRAQAQADVADKFQALLDDSPGAIMVVDDDMNVTYASATVPEMFGAQRLDHIRDFAGYVSSDDAEGILTHLLREGSDGPWTETFAVDTHGGNQRLMEIRISDLRDNPAVGGRLVFVREVTTEVQVHDRLKAQANKDSLTGLPNRRALTAAMAEQPNSVMLLADLDGFKQTNDSLGHDAGDEALGVIAKRFSDLMPPEAELFRLGGDEFAVVLPSENLDAASTVAAAMVQALHEPIALDQRFENLRTSIGIATSVEGDEPKQLLRRSDIALYEAKSSGGDQFKLFEESMEERADRNRNMLQALMDADLDTEFRVVFQPIVDSAQGDVQFMEALVRWNSPALGNVRPDEFIELTERSGHIVELGRWVMDTALGDLANLRSEGLAHGVAVSVNISPVQLEEEGFLAEVLDLVEVHRLLPEDLIVEVTESALVGRHGLAKNTLAMLRQAGCRVAVDDFGSGYSNLGQLLNLPLDILKVDRQLLVQLGELQDKTGVNASEASEVMRSIVSLGKAIGVPIVAEGIETVPQWESMHASGVQMLQGYLFSKPREASHLHEYFRIEVPV